MWGRGGTPWSAPRGCASGDPAVWRSSSCISCNHKDLLCLLPGRAWWRGRGRQQTAAVSDTPHLTQDGRLFRLLVGQSPRTPSQCGNNLALLPMPQEAGLLHPSLWTHHLHSIKLLALSPRFLSHGSNSALLYQEFTRAVLAPPVCRDMSGSSISLQTFQTYPLECHCVSCHWQQEDISLVLT